MKKQTVGIQAIRDLLRSRQFSGVPLTNYGSVAQTYGTFESLEKSENVKSAADDWAFVSYVQTNSALRRGGMPVWVAEDVEQVLDGLLDARIISQRAVWFDKIGERQTSDWPALATLHCLAAPVICVPPTRTIEYSRYQIPDRWDAATYDFFVAIERMLRACSTCGSKCPLEYDSRLLNIAASLRAWQTNEAIIGAAGRGAFISFATLDRLQYTIAWYQVLLQIAIDLEGYATDLLSKSVEFYGNALFQPCSRCLAVARQLSIEENPNVNCQLLDDALVALVMHANRFALPTATEKEGLEVWSLKGLFKSPGELYNLRKNNRERLRQFSRKHVSQSKLEQIAANICRGRPSLASCYRDGDKWLCAFVLSNIGKYTQGIARSDASFSEASNTELLEILQLDRPLGDLCYRDTTLEVEANRCIKSPACSGSNGCVCFWNELSGLLPPEAVGQFVEDRRVSRSDMAVAMAKFEEAFRRRLRVGGIALTCHLFEERALRDYGLRRCGACYRENMVCGVSRKRLVLFGWKAREETQEPISTQRDRASDDIVYSFIAIHAGQSSHVHSRGIFSRSNPDTCPRCGSKYIRIEVEGSTDVLEIHVRRLMPIATTLGMVYDAFSKCHKNS